MPAKQTDGRIALAQLTSLQTLHLAWGTGDPAWDATPDPEPITATALVAEVGRRLVTQVGFVTPDEAGAIETPQGNFALSEDPTRWLYVRTVFGFDEAPTAHIRELALFMNCTTNPTLPAGQRYFVPADIVTHGRLLILDRSQSFLRSGSVRNSFDYVLPF